MKKLITTFSFILFTIPVFAADIRQVMFGNNYEMIKEISEKEISEYAEELKASKFYIDHYEHRNKEHKYFRFFEQTIGDKKFIRVVKSIHELTDEYILNWRNPGGNTNHPYLVQLFYVRNPNEIFAVGPMCMMDGGGYSWENGTDNKYQMIEIIQRNNTVKGFLLNCLEDRIDHHNRAEESGIYTENYINTAEYYLFDDVINNAMETNGKVKYVKSYYDFPCVEIKTDQPLIDSKRPFMYTIQNAFDGNPATAYVENTDDDLMYVSLYRKEYNNIARLKLINGYSKNKELYEKNNRGKSIGGHYFDGYKRGFYSRQFITVEDKYNEIQIIDNWHASALPISEIYKGTKYNDTCISELDFFDDIYGWIFGE